MFKCVLIILFIVFTRTVSYSRWNNQVLYSSNLSTSLQDVDYHFDPAKLQSSKSVYLFYRSFVDLFYIVINKNENLLFNKNPLKNDSTWCLGDAHPENFGVLLLNSGRSIFTVNDIDDASVCSIYFDLLRFLVGIKLLDSEYMDSAFSEQILEFYIKGLDQNILQPPDKIQNLLSDSARLGFEPPIDLVKNDRIIRFVSKDNQELADLSKKSSNWDSQELDAKTLSQIQNSFSGFKNRFSSDFKILDAVEKIKLSGGSFGLKRYEVLIQNQSKKLLLEFKQQKIPSVYPIANSIPQLVQRTERALDLTQESAASEWYNIAVVNGIEMLVRPLFAGNIDLKLEKKKENNSKIKKYFLFQAYILGKIHSRSLGNSLPNYKKSFLQIPSGFWEQDMLLISDYFNYKFNKLKN